jgi:hypothetical protein
MAHNRSIETRKRLLRRLGRRDVIQECVRKRRFRTQYEAFVAYDGGRVYCCTQCGFWHCTRKGVADGG